MNPEAAAGAAAMLTYLRDLIMASSKRRYQQEELLVLLETISRDEDIFPDGTGVEMWAIEDIDSEMAMEAET